MIDPRIVLLLGAIYAATWGLGQTVKGVKWIGHHAKSAVHKIVHPHEANGK